MKPEKHNLIRDLLDDNEGRDEIFRVAGGVLRRRRHWRVAVRSVGVLVVMVLVGILFLRRDEPPTKSASVAKVAPKVSAAPQVQALTDEQLLSMFPSNTPVGIASLADGKKRLIFPRAGDEQRFITRL